jgi:hypothetical protein
LRNDDALRGIDDFVAEVALARRALVSRLRSHVNDYAARPSE